MQRCCQYCRFRRIISGIDGHIYVCEKEMNITLFKSLFGCCLFKPRS